MERKGPAIILVQPQMGENIGAAARAMLNCGLMDLRLVSPRDGWPNDAATSNASGAVSVIENTRLYDSLAEAIADRKFVIATTSRSRDMAKPILDPEAAADAIIKADYAAQASSSAIVFGPERAGLTNEDIIHCDAILNVPLNPDYASLNLAQAVLLVAYQWFRRQDAAETPARNGHDILALDKRDIADKGAVENLLDHLIAALEESRFFKTGHQRPVMTQNLYNMFQRMRLTSQEARSVHGMIKALRGREWKK